MTASLDSFNNTYQEISQSLRDQFAQEYTPVTVGGGSGGSISGGNGSIGGGVQISNASQSLQEREMPNPSNMVWDPVTPPRDMLFVKKTKKKVKVIDAVVDATDEKVKRLKEKIKRHDTQLQMEEKELKTRAQHINTIKTLKKNLESKSEVLSKKTKAELKTHYQSIIDRLMKEALIEKFETDMYQRVIITTKPILVKGLKWLLSKNAGVYQIRIDFNIDNWQQAIQILNITKNYQGYDSPTISNAKPCWGNIGGDIENEFNTQDLYELVIDLIDYIRSPNTDAGFLSNHGDKSGGWDIFFKEAVERPQNYSFEKHEEHEEDDDAETTISAYATWGEATPSLAAIPTPPSISNLYNNGVFDRTATEIAQNYAGEVQRRQELMMTLRNQTADLYNNAQLQALDPTPDPLPPRNARTERLNHLLYTLGLRENFIDVVSSQILENLTPNETMREMRIRMDGGNLTTLTISSDRDLNRMMAVEEVNSVPTEFARREFTLSIDIHFLRPNIVRDLQTTRLQVVRF